MSEAPLVSVVVPVYNHERYLGQTLQSVFDQDYPQIELIVIDDGSKDASAEYARGLLAKAPPHITPTFSARENRGAHATINEGLAKAQGEILTILNSDDAYGPTRLRRCVETLEAARARILFTYVDVIGDAGEPIPVSHSWRQWYSNAVLRELDVAPSLSTLLLSHNLAVTTGNLVFRRELLTEIGGFSDYRYAHDIDFLLRASLVTEPFLLREALYKYRLHGTNTISESDEKTGREYEEILENYFRATLEGRATNPFAPRLDRWTHGLASEFASAPAYLGRALDRLIEVPSRDEGAATPPVPLGAETRLDLSEAKITLLSHEASYTGAPVLLRDVAASAIQAGASCRLITMVPGPLESEFEAVGCEILRENLLVRALRRAGTDATRLANRIRPRRIASLLDRFSWLCLGIANRIRMPDYLWHGREGVLLINSFASWPLALSLARRWKGPVHWYIHETYDPSLLMRSDRAHGLLSSLARSGKIRMMFGSDATRAVWARAGYDGAVRYWSGLPVAYGKSGPLADKTRPVILSVQSTGTRKGTRLLVEAFAEGRRRGLIAPEVELRIVGCQRPSVSPIVRDLLMRINEPDLRGAIRLVGVLPPAALEAHYRQASVYVQSSIMECLPLALLTAMAHGLPIVSTDADGCREAIEDEVTGLLVPQRATGPLAEALGRLVDDDELAAKLGQAARERFVARFSLEATVPPLFEDVVRLQPTG